MLPGVMALLGSLSCEQAVTIQGTVVLPVEVQRQFSDSTRGILAIRAEHAASHSLIDGRTIYVFCDARSEDLKLPFRLTKFGCAAEMVVEAIVLPLTPELPKNFAELPCGEVYAPVAGKDSAAAVAYGRQTVFEGKDGGRCKSDTAVADITVELKK